MRNSNTMSTKSIILTGMCTAVLAVMSQISLPLPSGMPVTLQTFAIALTGCILGWKLGTAATLIYIITGVVGVPVFANFSGGMGVLLGYSGGFIFGFIFMAFLCGIAVTQRNKVFTGILAIAGLVICHLFGILQFSIIMKMSFLESAVLVSVPFLLKDIISVVMAFVLGNRIRKILKTASILNYA